MPLLPDDTPKPPDNPLVQGFEDVPGFCETVIVPPSPEVVVQVLSYLVQAFPAIAICQFTDPLLESFDRFGMDSDLRHPAHTDKRKAEILAQPRPDDPGQGN